MLSRCYYGSIFVVIKNKFTCKLQSLFSMSFISAFCDVFITPLTTHRTVLVSLICLIKVFSVSSLLNEGLSDCC